LPGASPEHRSVHPSPAGRAGAACSCRRQARPALLTGAGAHRYKGSSRSSGNPSRATRAGHIFAIDEENDRMPLHRPRIPLCALLAVFPRAAPAAAAPEGQMTWGVHISLAPTWFDPAETQGIITPFMVMYALHDALAKSMPGNPTAPALAESWQM